MPADIEYDVFLSYASEDSEWCENLAVRLRDEGVRVWFDKWQLQPGDHLLVRLNEGIEKSRKMIAVWTASYFRDDSRVASFDPDSSCFRTDSLRHFRRGLPCPGRARRPHGGCDRSAQSPP